MFLEGANLPASIEAEVCVVGAGAVGLSLAMQLAEHRRVVVLESGSLNLDPQVQALGRVQQVGLPTDDPQSTRIRAFGGTTAIWGGRCRPLEAMVFKRRPWVPHSGWPIDRDAVMPHIPRALELCGVEARGFQPERWGADLRDPRFENIVFLVSKGPLRFGERYRAVVERHERLTVCLGATAVSLSASGDRLAKVTACASDDPQRRIEVRAKAYVLACGAIQNARLLLANGLGNGHDCVGRYFLQHPHCAEGGWIAPRKSDYDLIYRATHREDVGIASRLTDAAQREHEILSAYYFGFAEWSPNEGTVRRRLGRLRKRLNGQRLMVELPWVVGALCGHSQPAQAMQGVLVQRPEQAPNPDSRVSLAGEKDALGLPLAKMDWRLTELDHRTFEVGRRLLAQTIGVHGRGRIFSPRRPFDRALHPDALPVHGGLHHMGTTRMSAAPSEGVVDADSKVWGLHNLFVAGSSVFPCSGYANPTLTAVALALRLAAHLKTTFGPM